jgi:glycosyltransferase involved in cell wall biosynthesis
MIKEKKVLLVTNIPSPYRIPLFNELHRQLENEGLKLKVVFGALGLAYRRWAVDMSECLFDYEILSSKKTFYSNPEKKSLSYSGLYRMISEYNPSIIIIGAFTIATKKLWLRSFFKKTPYIIWSGSIERKARHVSSIQKLQMKVLIKRAIGFIAYGTKAKEYLVSMGAELDKIEIGINTVDTQFYKLESEKWRKLTPNDNKKHLLYIGNLWPPKNVLKVVKVIHDLSNLRNDFILDIVGDGEEREQLEKYVEENNLNEFVTFHGYKQKNELPHFLAKADCFLFQTDFDIWGLVLVEAMAAGIPCISSIHAGATYDLIKNGITGFTVDFSETKKVVEKINWILANPELAKKVGQNASCYIEEDVNIEKSAQGFTRAVLKSGL